MTENYRLSLKVIPNARVNEVTGIRDGIIQVKINASPIEGKANSELVKYLADLLEIPKSNISILRGHTSRNKTIEIAGRDSEEISRRMGLD
ncbi:MAG: DUF167 domain-containing protein [Dehalococcoidales bacterium]|nr:DUF167 domain-containing protein [Dehalococcoidales bacterium]